MPNRTATALLLFFFAGMIGLWAAEAVSVPTAEERARRSGRILPQLIDVPASKITRVEVEGGDAPLAFERRGDDWWMVRPVEVPAERSKVEALVQSLKGLPRPAAGAEPLDGDPARYGLAPPRRVVRVYREGSDRPLAALEVGEPLREGRYVRPEGAAEAEVADALPLAGLDEPPHAWRDRSLFGRASFEVHGVEIRDEEGDLALAVHRGPRGWRLAGPIDAPGDLRTIEGLVADLTGLRAADGPGGFIADGVVEFAPFGLEPPASRIALNPGEDGPAEEVHLGAPVPDRPDYLHARRVGSSTVLAVPVAARELVERDPHAFRSRRVADLDPGAIGSLRVRAGDVEHVLRRVPDGWQQTEPVEGRADDTTANILLGAFSGLEATELIDPSGVTNAGLEPPAAVLSAYLGDPTDEPAARLTLGRRDHETGRLLARADGDTALLALPPDALDLHLHERLALLDRQLLRDPIGGVRRLSVTRGGRTYTLAASGGGSGRPAAWRMVEPVDAPADSEAASLLTALVANLRAGRILEQATLDPARHGLDRPWAVLSWTVEPIEPGGEPLKRSLTVGDELEGGSGGRIATLDDCPLVFTIEPNQLAILDAEPRDRRVLDLPPDRVARLTLRREGGDQTFRRIDRPLSGAPAWEREPGEGSDLIDPAELNGLMPALAALRAERFVSDHGPFPESTGLESPALVIELELQGGQGTRILRLGAPAGVGLRYATSSRGLAGAVFLVPDVDRPWTAALADTPGEPSDSGPG